MNMSTPMKPEADGTRLESQARGWRVAYDAFKVRLRFGFAIIALALLAAAWPWLANAWERLLARLSPYVLDSTVAANTEYFCPMDPGVVSVWPAICPICNMDLISRRKGDAVILPSGVVARMQLSPYRIALAGLRTVAVDERSASDASTAEAPDMELLVPATTVVHWGAEAVVYVESMPGMFDGIPVRLGKRKGDSYVVLAGLEPGQRVVALGTLLVDAETRLNPHLSTQYFGATTQPAAEPPPPIQRASLAKSQTLGLPDQQLVDAQRFCPVTRAKLGSMGVPVFVDVGERKVAICCAGCRGRLLAEPSKYLKWLDERLAEKDESK